MVLQCVNSLYTQKPRTSWHTMPETLKYRIPAGEEDGEQVLHQRWITAQGQTEKIPQGDLAGFSLITGKRLQSV